MNTIVTFTGIDERTDIDRLCQIQEEFPFAEFGVLIAPEKQGKENRFPGLNVIDNLAGRGLNLAAHLCGKLAKDTNRDGFQHVNKYLGKRIEMFQRVQLNIAGPHSVGCGNVDVDVPNNIQEVIIQHHPNVFLKIEDFWDRDVNVSVLIDGSGGKGVKMKSFPVYTAFNIRVGYAGGLDREDAAETYFNARQMLIQFGVENGLWIDMESRIRKDDWLNLDDVHDIASSIADRFRHMK